MCSDSDNQSVKRLAVFISAISISIFSTFFMANFTFADEEENTNVKGVSNEYVEIEIISDPPRVHSIFKPKSVTITHKNTVYSGITYAATVKEAIQDFGVELTDNSFVTPDPGFCLGVYTSIQIDEVIRERHTEYEYIEFERIKKEDDTLEWGKEIIAQPGVTGQRKMEYEYLYINEVYKGKTLISQDITVQPQEEIVSIGTKKVFREITIDGDTFSYWRTMTVLATSYDQYCAGCNQWTATGKIVTKGIVAVDPTVIPMHTRMYIPGYGPGQAEDTGGAIKGYKIDLGFDDLKKHQGEWSRRYVEIYLLD